MSFAVVIEGMTIAAFAILLGGGKQRRESGWGALAILTALAAFVQAIGMALMVSCQLDDWTKLTSSGISLRERRSILQWLVPRQELVIVYSFLDI
jgi:formate hydrogenlyase subunit 3/multisubunit Na+/H+ antiporter MnhD subunit